MFLTLNFELIDPPAEGGMIIFLESLVSEEIVDTDNDEGEILSKRLRQ